MIRKLLYITICCLWVHLVHAQDLKPTVVYMNAADVSQIAKDIHSGKVVAANNELTYSIADSMSTENNETRPFYIFLVSKTLQNTTDDSLRLVYGEYCRFYIQNNPDAAISLLFSKTVKPVYKYAWAKAIATDISNNCETTIKECFKTARILSLERCRSENKDKLEIIFNQVRANLNLQGR